MSFTVRIENSRRSRLFRCLSMNLSVSFHRNWNNVEPAEVPQVLYTSFADILREVSEYANCMQTDYMRFRFDHPKLNTPVWIPFQQRKDISASSILNHLAKVLQSNQEFRLDENLTLSVCHVSPPDGHGTGKVQKKNFLNVEKYVFRKRSLVTIKNTDDLCFQRAIVVAMHYANKDESKEWETARHRLTYTGPRTYQTLETYNLIEQVNGRKEACQGRETWEEYAKYLGPLGYQLNIYSKELFGRAAYKSTRYVVGQGKPINLYHHDKHYDVITSMPAFMERSYYCKKCQVGYNNANDHQCHAQCDGCKKAGPPCQGNLHFCQDCNRTFNSLRCFQRHKESTCDRWKRCLQCSKEWDTIKQHRPLDKHICGEYKCRLCNVWHQKGDRWCNIKTLESPVDVTKELLPQIDKQQSSELTRFVFFDFECQQDSGQHVPNLCVLHLCCHYCIRQPLGNCERCGRSWAGQQEVIFRGPETLDHVGQWFLQLATHRVVEGGDPDFFGTILAIAHNFKGYDGILMLQAIHRHAMQAPEVIMSGGKVMTLSIGCVKFVDSLNFLTMPLRDMPATFGLTELKKGYFPHFFNRPENADYVGEYPPAEDYDPEGMSVKEREKFYRWYNQQQGTFDFQEELLSYCQSDVDVLKRCCGEFRQIFLQDTAIDPFLSSLTLASACNRVYRTHFLEANTLVVIPRALMEQPEPGKDWKRFQPRQQSNKALRWLEWQQNQLMLQGLREGTPLPDIRHARNGGEVKVGPYSLDGLDRVTSTAYEFHGCAFHGCPKCFPGPVQDLKHHHPYDPSRTMRDLLRHTEERIRRIKTMGISNVVVAWECEVENERRENKEMDDFFLELESKHWPVPDPLMPRDAFFGGRTNAIQLMVDAKPGEEMRYIDVVSLYPYVCKYGKFPIKEPTIINLPEKNWDQYEGLVQCQVLAPRGLYHPVLPYRCNNKLTFPLCRTCVQERMENLVEYQPCCHTDEQRSWIGTYVSLELKKAVERGYKVLQVFEVWHWEEWAQYDPTTKSGGLFAGYIDHYLKKKMESSGYPDECITPEQKAHFIKEVERKEGILLDHQAMVPNKGLRAFSKMQLNTIWGKMAQRDNFSKTEYMTEPHRFFELLEDATETIKDAYLVNENMVMVERLKKEEHVQTCPITNVVVAAFVTAQARLKLYSVLEPLGDRVCYFDTDSVIYKYDPTAYNPPEGNSLGEWKNELPENVSITSFVSGGPKNYAYQMSNGETVCKVRGFTLNYRAGQLLNFHTMKELILEPQKSILISNPFKIIRTKDKDLKTRSENKQYGIVYTKRCVVYDKDIPVNTLPYGY